MSPYEDTDPDQPRDRNENVLALRLVYQDEHLIELEARVVSDGWSGRSTAYATCDQVLEFAGELRRFNTTQSGEARLEAGRDDGIGLIGLRFYKMPDYRAAVRCHVRLTRAAG